MAGFATGFPETSPNTQAATNYISGSSPPLKFTSVILTSILIIHYGSRAFFGFSFGLQRISSIMENSEFFENSGSCFSCAIVFVILHYNPDNFVFPDGHDFNMERSQNPYERYEKFIRAEQSSQYEPNAPVIKLIGGICALLLLGYLLVICYQKFMMDSKADAVDPGNALHKLSLESGKTEYELFVIAAEEWSITEAQIDKDFKNYMAANILPYYVMDLVRKNDNRISKSLEKEGEIEPTSRWDLVKALLLFPGCFLIPYFLVIILRPYFSHNF